MSKKKSPQFETNLKELEKIVTSLEKGDISLEESLQAFAQGMALAQSCQQALTEAEQQIQILMEKNGQLMPLPYATGDDHHEP